MWHAEFAMRLFQISGGGVGWELHFKQFVVIDLLLTSFIHGVKTFPVSCFSLVFLCFLYRINSVLKSDLNKNKPPNAGGSDLIYLVIADMRV